MRATGAACEASLSNRMQRLQHPGILGTTGCARGVPPGGGVPIHSQTLGNANLKDETAIQRGLGGIAED